MSATKVGIVYSLALSKRRWMVVPDSDAELPLQPRAGEGYVEQSMSDYQKLGPDAAVQQATGKAPLSDRCCVVQTGVVASVICADPACDVLPSATLVLHPTAQVGWTYSNGVLMVPMQTTGASSGGSTI